MNGYTSQLNLIESNVGLFLNDKFQTTNNSNEEGEASVHWSNRNRPDRSRETFTRQPNL